MLWKSIKDYFFSHIILVIMGVGGFLSAIVTLFIDINALVSIKWLIFVIFISLVIVALLIGLLNDT